jgi:hypothetical protein
MANRTKFTPKKKAAFCEMLVETGGNVTAAASAMGLSRQGCYRYRDEKDSLHDVDFVALWDAAIEAGTENLEAEAYRRAHDGTLEPHFHQGEECGYVRKYSDTLTIFLLKARKRNVYDPPQRQELSGPNGTPIQTEEISQARSALEHCFARRFTVTRAPGVDSGNNGNSG